MLTTCPPEALKAFRLADNKTAELAEWDFEKLESELAELRELEFDLEQFGFTDLFENDEAGDNLADNLEENRPSLMDRFIIPPFSVLDTRQGYWQDRKKIWKQIIKSGAGRETGLLGDGLFELAKKQGADLTGTSIFDPVLCETLINWFCPPNSKIIDPFAGGSVRGLISVLLGNEYTGVDLSAEQIGSNYENFNAIAAQDDLEGNPIKRPNWINADSLTIDELVRDTYDFLLTCPPYADLEVYSTDERDLSNMPYEKFIDIYGQIISKTADKLRDNAFAVFVVGDVRDKKGYYHNFVGDTIKACKKAGLKHYNECILLEQVATAALRAGRQFEASRKVVKTHQNVLVFVKGNEKEIMNLLLPYNYDFSEKIETTMNEE